MKNRCVAFVQLLHGVRCASCTCITWYNTAVVLYRADVQKCIHFFREISVQGKKTEKSQVRSSKGGCEIKMGFSSVTGGAEKFEDAPSLREK